MLSARLGWPWEKGSKKIGVGIFFFGDMNGKDVTPKDEVHGEGVVGMNKQSEIMKYRPSSRARGKSRGV